VMMGRLDKSSRLSSKWWGMKSVIKRIRVMSPAITSRSDMMMWYVLRDGVSSLLVLLLI